jgi:hypothetical protein
MKRMITSSLATAALALPSFANAAGPFDGTWEVDSAGLGTETAPTVRRTSCEPETLRFEVKDNQVRGGLASPHSDPERVRNNKRPRSAPISGAVQADGTVSAQWENYAVTGKMIGDNVELYWRTSCGPRVAIGSRIAHDVNSGSTASPPTNPPLVPTNPSARQ